MIEVFNCDQGTPAWFDCRKGIPTASMFATVMASGKGGGESKTRRDYLLRLAGEIITGKPADTFSNHHMERGREMEPEAREFYAFLKDVAPEQVGFIRNGNKGCSPDSLIGTAGLLEIKTKLPALVIDCILRDDFPPGHKAQCQGQLWCAEREWLDLAIYWPGMPPVIQTAHRDDAYIATLAAAVDAFNDELAEIVERVRAYGQPIATEKAA